MAYFKSLNNYLRMLLYLEQFVQIILNRRIIIFSGLMVHTGSSLTSDLSRDVGSASCRCQKMRCECCVKHTKSFKIWFKKVRVTMNGIIDMTYIIHVYTTQLLITILKVFYNKIHILKAFFRF